MITASVFPCPFDPTSNHDANAAIVTDDNIYAYEEEKLTGSKDDLTIRFSERSLLLGCRELGISPDQVDKWALTQPSVQSNKEDLYLFFSGILKAYKGDAKNFQSWMEDHVEFIPHHQAHAALSIFGSRFDDCVFVTADGGGDAGDRRSLTWGEYRNGEFNLIGEQAGLNGLGSFHNYVTDALGFRQLENGKTSGLAGYGIIRKDLEAQLASLLRIDNDQVVFNRVRNSPSRLNLEKLKPPEYNRDKVINTYPSSTNVLDICLPYLPQDIAATGESILHKTFFGVLKHIRECSNLTKVVFSGGLFQNVALNKAIIESGLFDDYYFPMAPGDSGLALGSALYVQQRHSGLKSFGERLSALIGPSFDDCDVMELLDRFRLMHHQVDNPSKSAAKFIAEGKVVGWFNGRGEYGPRSLGARSILADPRNLEVKARVNQFLKRREWFMPYAPAIQEEFLSDWTDVSCASPFMQIASPVIKNMQSLIPAAVHVDGTSRFQLVRKKESPAFWELIEQFRNLTGIPLILNTSFNRHGVPTISSPRQAIEHLLEGCMDVLFIEKHMIVFDENRNTGNQDITPKNETELLRQLCQERFQYVCEHGNDGAISKYRMFLSDLLKE